MPFTVAVVPSLPTYTQIGENQRALQIHKLVLEKINVPLVSAGLPDLTHILVGETEGILNGDDLNRYYRVRKYNCFTEMNFLFLRKPLLFFIESWI